MVWVPISISGQASGLKYSSFLETDWAIFVMKMRKKQLQRKANLQKQPANQGKIQNLPPHTNHAQLLFPAMQHCLVIWQTTMLQLMVKILGIEALAQFEKYLFMYLGCDEIEDSREEVSKSPENESR